MSPKRKELDKLIMTGRPVEEIDNLLRPLTVDQQRFAILAEPLQNGQTALHQVVEQESFDVSVLGSSAIDTFPTD